MIVDRTTYIDQLIRSKGNGLIKIITGLRRSGKSFLLKTLSKVDIRLFQKVHRHWRTYKTMV